MGKSYSIMPFVPRLKTWIQRQKKLKRRDVRRYSKDRLAPQLDDYSSSDGSESDVEDEQPRSSKRKKASKGTQSASIPPTPAAPQTVTTEVPTTTTHTAGNLPAIPEPSLVAASSSSSATDALKALLGVGMSLPAESDLLPLPLAHIGQTGALTDQSNDIMRLLHNAAKSPRLAQSDLGIVSVAIAPSKIEAPGPPGHLREETTSRTSDLLTLLKGTGGKTVPEHSAVETLKLPRVDGAVDVMESLVPGLAKKKELPKSITTPPRMLVTITPSEVPADILSSVQYVPLKGVGGEEGTDNVSGRPETPQLEGSEARTPPRRPSTTVPVTPTTPWLPPRPHAPIPPTPTSPAVFLFSEQQLKGPDFGDTSIPATLGAPGAAQPSLLDLLRNGTDKGQEIPSQSMPFNAEVPVMDSSALLNFSLDINDLLKQL